MNPANHIYPWLFVHPPGTGGSWTLGSMMEVEGVERGLLLAPKPSEADSFFYRKHARLDRLDIEIYRDTKWAPVIERYEAEAFRRIFERVIELYDDERYDVIILDPLTDVSMLAAHAALAPARVATPGELDGKNASIAFYGGVKHDMREFTQSLVGLSSEAAKRPKHVLVSVHAQPTKEEDLLGKQTPEGRAKGVSFMGDILPAIEGSYRQEVAAEFSVVGFNSVKYETVKEGNTRRREARYVVQLNADPEKHAKARIAPRLKAKEVANNMTDILTVIEEAQEEAT